MSLLTEAPTTGIEREWDILSSSPMAASATIYEAPKGERNMKGANVAPLLANQYLEIAVGISRAPGRIRALRTTLYEAALKAGHAEHEAPAPPEPPKSQDNLVSDVVALTGYTLERLSSILGVTRQTLSSWKKGNKTRVRKDSELAKQTLSALQYAGLAFYRRGGPESVQAWLEGPAHDRPIDLLKHPDGPQHLIARVNETVY